jgi:hypothetical protein
VELLWPRRQLPPLHPRPAFAGFNAGCLFGSQPSGWRNLTLDQIININPPAWSGLPDTEISYIPDANFAQLPLATLDYLSVEGISGIIPNKLVLLIQNYGVGFLQLYKNVTRWVEYPVRNMIAFRSLVPSVVPKMTFDYNLSTLSWIELAVMDDSVQPAFDDTFFTAIPDSTIGGLRQDQLDKVPDSAFASISPAQAPFFPGDLLGSLATAGKLNYFTPATFNAIPVATLELFTPAQWALVNGTIIAGLDEDDFGLMECSLLMSFTPDQIAAMNYTQVDYFLEYKYDCEANQPTDAPTTKPTTAPTPTPTTTGPLPPYTTAASTSPMPTTSIPHPTPTTSYTTTAESVTKPTNKIPAGAAFGFVVLGLVIGAVVASVASFFILKKSRRYQPID